MFWKNSKKARPYTPAFSFPLLSPQRMAVYEMLLEPHRLMTVSRLQSPPYMSVLEKLPEEIEDVVHRECGRFSAVHVYRYGPPKLYEPGMRYQPPPHFFLIGEYGEHYYSLMHELDPDLSGRQPNGLSPIMEAIAKKNLNPPPATIGRAWIFYLCVFLLGIPFALEILELGGGEWLTGLALMGGSAGWFFLHLMLAWCGRHKKIGRLNKLLWPLVAETETLKENHERNLQAYSERLTDDLKALLPHLKTPVDLDAAAQPAETAVLTDVDDELFEPKPEPAAAAPEEKSEIENVLNFPAPDPKPAAA